MASLRDKLFAQLNPFDQGKTWKDTEGQVARAKRIEEEQRQNLVNVTKNAYQNGTPGQKAVAARTLRNKSWAVKPAVTQRNPIGTATSSVGYGLGRSGIGTAQGLSGLYDLVTPGTGTSRTSKLLDTKAKGIDQTVKDQNLSQVGYKGAQFLGDALQFTAGGPVLKGTAKVATKIPAVQRIATPTTKLVTSVANKVEPVAKHIPIAVEKAGYALAQKGAAGRVASQAIRKGLTKPQMLNTAVDMGLGLGQMASKGQDIGAKDVALQGAMSLGFGMGGPAAAQGAREIFRTPSRMAISRMPVRPEALNPGDIAALSNWRNTMGTGRTMGDSGRAIYDAGRVAAAKAGIDYLSPSAIDSVLGTYNTYRVRTDQQIRALQNVNDRLNKLPVGLGIKDVSKGAPIEKTPATLDDVFNDQDYIGLFEPAKKQANAFQDTLPSKSRPNSVKDVVKGGGTPLYHDTDAKGIMGILETGTINPSQAPFSQIAGQGKRVSTTRNFDNYSRYQDSPYRLVIDESKTGQKSIPDNREEFESIFNKPVSTKAVQGVAVDITNPALIKDIQNGTFAKVVEKAKQKGITIEPFEGKILPKVAANAEIQKLTKELYAKSGAPIEKTPQPTPDPTAALKQEAIYTNFNGKKGTVVGEKDGYILVKPEFGTGIEMYTKEQFDRIISRQNDFKLDAQKTVERQATIARAEKAQAEATQAIKDRRESMMDYSGMTPMQKGRLDKMLSKQVNVWGKQGTLDEVIAAHNPRGKIHYRNGAYGLVLDDSSKVFEVPKTVWDKLDLDEYSRNAYGEEAIVRKASQNSRQSTPQTRENAIIPRVGDTELPSTGTIGDQSAIKKGNIRPDTLTTLSGRQVQLPQYNPKNQSSASIARQMRAWNETMIDAAIEEAKHKNDSMNLSIFTGMKKSGAKNLSQSDQSSLNLYLFGDPDGIKLSYGGKTPERTPRSFTQKLETGIANKEKALQDGKLKGFQEYRLQKDKELLDAINQSRQRTVTTPKPTLSDALEGKSTKIPKQVNTLERPLDIPKRVSVEKPSLGNARQVTSLKSQSSPLLPKDTPQVVKPKSQSVPPKTPPTKQVSSYSNNTPELPEYNTKRVSLLDKAFRSTRSIIERQGESGKKLAGMLQNQRDTKELWIRDIEKRLPTVQKLKTKEFENFVEATQGNAKPLNSKVESAIKEWQSVHPEIRQRGVDAGLEIGDLGETYYPHFIDYDKIYKDKNTYNQAINHLVKTGQAETPEKAIELLGYARDLSRNREFGNLEASRIIDLPFYDRSKASLGAYLQGSSDRITKAEMFGKGDEEALKLIKKIGVEGGDTEAAKNAFDVAVGAKKFNPTTSKISSGIRHYTTVTRLGLGALTNVSQSVNTGIVTGHMNTLKAVVKQLDPKTRQMAADTGVISDAIIQDLRRGFGQETFGSSKAGKAVNFITAPGFKQVESFNRRVAATAGRDYALRLAQKGDEKTLRKLGVTGEIKNGTLTTAQQTQAARKVVEKTQFKVDPQDLPGWTASPGGKLVSQFRTFSYSQGKFFSNEILKPAAKGNLMPLVRLMAALPLGYGLYEVRRQIDGRPEEENKVKVGLQSWGKVGGAGLVLDLYQGLNPVGSKYLPSDRRVSMAVGTVGGPSVGTAANAVGALSEAIQRKRTPDDPSRLGGKVVVGNTGDMYTDLTPAARLAMQQIPIVGTPIMNRVLPYKKQSDSDIGKKDQPDFNSKLTLDEAKKNTKKRIENAFGKEYANMNQTELEAAAESDANAAQALKMYKQTTKAFGKPLDLPKDLPASVAKVLTSADRAYNIDEWKAQKNSNKDVEASLKQWANGKDIPPITNEVAKEWAEYQKDYKEGKISKLKINDKKKSILQKAFKSQLATEEQDILSSSVSKAELKNYIESGLVTESMLQNALGVEKKMFDAGVIDKEYLAKKLGKSARGYKYSSSVASGRRGSYSPTKFMSQSTFNTSLRKMLENAI